MGLLIIDQPLTQPPTTPPPPHPKGLIADHPLIFSAICFYLEGMGG